MSQENVELVASLYRAVNRRDEAGATALWHQEGEWRPATTPGGIERERYLGHEGVHRWLRDVEESWAVLEAVDLSFRQADDERVLVLGRLRGKGAASGVEIDAPLAALFSVQNGKVARGTGYQDPKEALNAAGLQDSEMTHGKAALTRRWVAAFNDRDMKALSELIGPGFEFHPFLATMIERSTYRGIDGLRSYYADSDQAWQHLQARLEEVHEVDNRYTISYGEILGKGRASGLDVRVPVAWVAEWHLQKVVRLVSYPSKSEARDAVELRE